MTVSDSVAHGPLVQLDTIRHKVTVQTVIQVAQLRQCGDHVHSDGDLAATWSLWSPLAPVELS